MKVLKYKKLMIRLSAIIGFEWEYSFNRNEKDIIALDIITLARTFTIRFNDNPEDIKEFDTIREQLEIYLNGDLS